MLLECTCSHHPDVPANELSFSSESLVPVSVGSCLMLGIGPSLFQAFCNNIVFVRFLQNGYFMQNCVLTSFPFLKM